MIVAALRYVESGASVKGSVMIPTRTGPDVAACGTMNSRSAGVRKTTIASTPPTLTTTSGASSPVPITTARAPRDAETGITAVAVIVADAVEERTTKSEQTHQY